MTHRAHFLLYIVNFGVFSLVLTFPDYVYKKEYKWKEEGDINIGAILSIHSSDSLFNCTNKIQNVRNVQNVEVLSYAVKTINENKDILPNLTLGFVVLDDCLSPSIALARAIQFMPRDIRLKEVEQIKDVPKVRDEEQTFYDVIGVIGTYTSQLSIVVANVLNLFQLPQISHTATSDVLSDKSRFPYFFRMVPPDRYQAKTIASLLRHFKWDHVSIVYSEGNYGRDGVKVLRNTLQSTDSGVCIESDIEIAYSAKEEDLIDILQILNSEDTKVVIAFVEIKDALLLSSSIKEAHLINRFIWIGSDSMGLVFEDTPEVCDILPGSIAVHPHSMINKKLINHINLLNNASLEDISRNPWLNTVQSSRSDEKVLHNSTRCQINCLCNPSLHQMRTTFVDSFLNDSVYALAQALHNVVQNYCNTIVTRNEIARCVAKKGIFEELKNLKLNGHSNEFVFNSDGDAMTKYEVNQCSGKRGHQPANVESLGFWFMDGERLEIDEDAVIWHKESIPTSSCPRPCTDTIGTIYYFKKKTCCHVCITCKVNEIVTANATRCDVCEKRYWPDEQRNVCLPITPSYSELDDGVSIALCAVAIVGALLCFWIIVILVKYRDEHVIKCFSIELSGIILFGTLLTYGLTASFLSRPNSWKCYLNHVGFSLIYTMIYAPLLVKTNRIYRIFNSGRRTTRKPCFISTSSQVLFSLLLIFMQIAIVIISTSIEPPEVILHMPQRTVKFVELFCNLPRAGLLSSLSYNLVLVVICTFYAFKTRKLPDNYKESRYIAFCVDTTLLIWITFVPTYFTTTRAYAKTTILAISLLLNASVTVTCLFIPRIYSLYGSFKNGCASTSRYKDFKIVKHVVKRQQSTVMLEVSEQGDQSGMIRRTSSALTNSDIMSHEPNDVLLAMTHAQQPCLEMKNVAEISSKLINQSSQEVIELTQEICSDKIPSFSLDSVANEN